MSKDGTANRIADLLEIKYAHAVRLIRTVNESCNEPFGMSFPDLAHACRALLEKQKSIPAPERPKRRRGVLPKGAGKVRCTACGAEACDDDKDTPITLYCKEGCPERQPMKIKGHRYAAGHPRDDGNGCTFVCEPVTFDDEAVICGLPEDRHERSEYGEGE